MCGNRFGRVGLARRVGVLASLLAALFFSAPAQAQSAAAGPQTSTLPQPGHTACSRFVVDHAQGRTHAAMDFISGYGTARYAFTTRRAVAETDPYFGLSRTATAQWLADWCVDNPRRSLADAAPHFFDQLAGAGPLAEPFKPAPGRLAASPPASTCSAPAVGLCAGCSATCAAPTLAVCSAGREGPRGPLVGARCGAPSYCECR